MIDFHALPTTERRLFSAVVKTLREDWNPLAFGDDRRGWARMRSYHDCERDVFELVLRGADADAIAARLADVVAPPFESRAAIDRQAAEAIVSVCAHLLEAAESSASRRAPRSVRRPGYRSITYPRRWSVEASDRFELHAEHRLSPSEISHALAQVFGLVPNLVRTVAREAELEGWIWSGGVDVSWEHPMAGFGTRCEVICELEAVAPLDIVVALSTLLDMRVLHGAPGPDACWRHLVRPSGTVAVTALSGAPEDEDDGRAMLPCVGAPFAWPTAGPPGEEDRSVPERLARLVRRLDDDLPAGWTRVRLEQTCRAAEETDGWRRELFADVSFADEVRYLDVADPGTVSGELQRLGRVLEGDGPAVRNVLVTLAPGTAPRAALTDPGNSYGPSALRFPVPPPG